MTMQKFAWSQKNPMTCIQDQGVSQRKSQEIQKLPIVGVLQGLSICL